MTNPPHAVQPRRTAAQAVQQAEAKAGIRNARALRAGGGMSVVFGASLLVRRSTWLPWHQLFLVHIRGGSTFSLSLNATAGILAVALGPVAALVGHWLLKRREAAARADSVTRAIFDQPSQLL